jgi:hypothetical protein
MAETPPQTPKAATGQVVVGSLGTHLAQGTKRMGV